MSQIVSAQLYSASGSFLGELPNFQSIQVQEQLNTENAWQMLYDLNGIGASNLIADEDREVAVLLDGNEVFRGVIEDDSWDEVNSESAFVTLAGRGMAGMLEFAKVYPNGGVGHKPASHTFHNATPGQIFKTLFLEAQARGCLPGWTLSFSETADSNSQSWSTLISITYQAGVSLLDIIKSFGGSNQADFRITGNTINMWNPKTVLGASTNVTFRRGLDIISSPRARTRRNLQTVALVQGDNDVTVERTDSTGVSARGRKEGYTSQGGITDTGTLNTVGDNVLSVRSPARLSKTHRLSFDPQTPHPVPWVDYLPGDYVYTDLSGTVENYRLVALNMTLTNSDNVIQGEVTLNDVLAERDVVVADQLNQLGGGGTSTSAPSTGTAAPGADGTTPGIPSFITPFQMQTYVDYVGVTKTRVLLSWSAPLNTDGSVIVDGDHYEIRYKLNTSVAYPQTWAALGASPWNTLQTWAQPFTPNTTDWQIAYAAFSDTTQSIENLPTGVGYDVQIRCVDSSGNVGAWSATTSFTTNADNIAPSIPDAPSVAASRIAIQVTHDLGKATGGTFNLEQDLHHLEIHADYEPTFVPTTATLLGKLPATQGMIQAQVPAVGTFQIESVTTVYVRVIAVDQAGNRSAPSAAASQTAELIDDAHISSLTVSKVTAGTISADFIVGARIKTADTGVRVELSPSGIVAYNAAGTQTVNISSADGSATIIGQLKSGNTGNRVEINPTATLLPELRFYPDTGTNYAFINSVPSADGTVPFMGVNTGQFTMHSTTQEWRLYMRDTIAALECIKSSDESRLGAYVSMDTNGVSVAYTDGLSDYGHSYVSNTYAEVGFNASSDDSDCWIGYNSDGHYNWIGKFYNYASAYHNQSIFTGSVGWATNSGVILSYGATMLTTPVPILTLYYTGGASIAWWNNARSTTSFSITCTVSNTAAAASINATASFWCYRV